MNIKKENEKLQDLIKEKEIILLKILLQDSMKHIKFSDKDMDHVHKRLHEVEYAIELTKESIVMLPLC